MHEWMLAAAAYAWLLLIPSDKQLSLEQAGLPAGRRKAPLLSQAGLQLRVLAEIFLQTCFVLCVEWYLEDYLSQAAQWRLMSLVILSWLSVSIRKKPDLIFFSVYVLSALFIRFKRIENLAWLILAVGSFAGTVFIFQIFLLGLREKLHLSSPPKAIEKSLLWVLFFSFILLSSETWISRLTFAPAFGWDFEFRGLPAYFGGF